MFRLLIFLIFALTAFFKPYPIYAVNYSYSVDYFLSESKSDIDTQVKFAIKINDLDSNTYIEKFALTFPKSFDIKNVSAGNEHGRINSIVKTDESQTKIELQFPSPDSTSEIPNNFNIDFDQENLFKVNGNIWEVILPVIEGGEIGNYTITVHLPTNSNKKLSIAKPKPDHISNLATGKQIVWSNPKTKTVYAVFGDRQYYNLGLRYNLENPRLTAVYTEIALPPDTSYQKTYLLNINPKPTLTYIDDDGNFMARYTLKPKEKKEIIYSGIVEVFSTHRVDVAQTTSENFKDQRNFLLTAKNFWSIDQRSELSALETPLEIYNFVVKFLKYDYSRVNKNVRRLGASFALKNPTTAVCTEFSDLFIAIAREKGIATREIQGYGFSNDSQLRPLSLVSDVLHSWPEYYDTAANLWKPVDPTWENTSGIDYFNSFDLNHIVFAIHGKDPERPLPAGMYKIEDTKDLLVAVAKQIPEEISKVSVDLPAWPSQLTAGKKYEFDLKVKNEGNTFVWNIPVSVESENLQLTQNKFLISQIAPYEVRTITLNFKPKTSILKSGDLEVLVLGDSKYKKQFKIIPYQMDLAIKLGYLLFGAIGIYFSARFLPRIFSRSLTNSS